MIDILSDFGKVIACMYASLSCVAAMVVLFATMSARGVRRR